MAFVDFSALKEKVSIVQAIEYLNLKVDGSNGTLRGRCPACEKEGRSLVLNPDRGMFFCHKAKRGGDVISLAAHIRKESTLSAALFLDECVPANDEPVFQPLEHLDGLHEKVKAIGFPQDVCSVVGIGYCAKGLMRGFVAVPVRTPEGKLIGYIGIESAKLPKVWHL